MTILDYAQAKTENTLPLYATLSFTALAFAAAYWTVDLVAQTLLEYGIASTCGTCNAYDHRMQILAIVIAIPARCLLTFVCAYLVRQQKYFARLAWFALLAAITAWSFAIVWHFTPLCDLL